VLRKLKSEFDFQVRHRGFQIHPEWPAEGMPAEQWRPEMPARTRQQMWERIGEMGRAAGIDMKPPRVLANSMLALQAGEFAADHGLADAFDERVFHAYFTEGTNIGNREVLLEIGSQAGLDRAELADALGSSKYAMRIKNNAQSASQKGINGVPTMIIGDWPLVGAQSEDVMRRVLRRASEMMESGE
jgi:predicted DsbA family dithiol-disulfide isomerase